MRVCLVKVSSQPESHAEVLGHSDIRLDTFVCQYKTERWFHLLEGTFGTKPIGHLRIRALW